MRHSIYWTVEKIAARLKLIAPLVHKRRHPMKPFRYKALAGPMERAPTEPGTDISQWQEIPFHTYWGTWSTDFVLATHFSLPADLQDVDGPLALHLPLGVAGDIFTHPEALAYVDGRQETTIDRHHHELLVPHWCQDENEHFLALRGWTGLSGWPPDRNAKDKLFMRECAIVEIHEETQALCRLAATALDVAKRQPETSTAKNEILKSLDAAFKVLDTRDPVGGDAFYGSVPAALTCLKEGLKEGGAPLEVDLIAIGHAHLDLAYMWTVDQSRRKTGRTFANVLHMMETFEDYKFSQSQPLQYQFAKEDYPELWEKVKTRVADGRWEAMGGMWVEPDCVITGAEALARQIVYGRRWYRDEFGAEAETPVLWLPDSFGFTWSLPQLMKEAGLKWFVTNKLNWNQYNQMPFQLMWWQGLDGSKVLAHFLTTPRQVQYLPYATTYKAELTADEVFGTWENFRQKPSHNELIIAFGYGDGGGGPTRDLIETLHAYEDIPGTPRLRSGTVKEFFENVEADPNAHEIPTWNNEFYLELHRGTLTSQARAKWHNRKCEFLLQRAEFLCALAELTAGHTYPESTLRSAWELVLLNQFHDILPGSSITEVYEETLADYATVRHTVNAAIDDAIDALASSMPKDATTLVVNAQPFGGGRTGFLAGDIETGLMDLRDERSLLTQTVEGGTLIETPIIEPYSVIALGETAKPANTRTGLKAELLNEGGAILENFDLKVMLAPNGEISSIFDKKAKREVLAEGKTGNQLLAFEDRPVVWDAWDIDIYYEDRCDVIDDIMSLEVTETGPLRATVMVKRAYQSSSITQRISLDHRSKRIDFDTEIEWRESHTLLKTAFPVAVLTPTATYDIQWGNMERTTHRNTSWDLAHFESAAQKWADLSEGNYGVALLNDCKYGYDIHHNVMRLSLIKSATMPDPVADQGHHTMKYALLPHEGDWRREVPRAAYDLNNPLIVRPVTNSQGRTTWRHIAMPHKSNLIIETIKRAEDGNGLIMRLFENHRERGPVTVQFGFDVAAVFQCNLLEDVKGAVPVKHNHIELDVKPYQIITLRVIAALAGGGVPLELLTLQSLEEEPHA
ncbi:MAG: glycoside hydrolase family 38 C-terminal domain-containing protein [Pseudomonadota bacterium]